MVAAGQYFTCKVFCDVEHLGWFTNGVDGSVSANGIKNLGGFGGTTPPGAAPSDIARFKVRVDNDQPVTLTVNASTTVGGEFLLHGGTGRVDPAKITGSTLTTQLPAMSVTAANRQQDVNSDGVITALDVLQVINYINARDDATAESVTTLAASSVETTFDITGDGVVSGLDVLQIINTINSRDSAPASGEGSIMGSAAVDQFFAIDLDESQVSITARRKR